jgi:ABC-type uncharacterized transport system substrate-binding protein
MKTGFFKALGVFAAVSLLWAAGAAAAGKVVVVTGVAEQTTREVGTYLPVFEGIKQALNEKNADIVFQYVELDNAPDEAVRAQRGKDAVQKAMVEDPDVVMVLNDECVKYVGMEIKDVPVVFAWIFSNPKELGLPKDNITGVTRRSFAPDIWSLANQITGAQTVALLSKNNRSMAGVRSYIMAGADKLEQASGVRVKEMYLCDTFDQWSELVENWKYDLIYLADTSRIEKDGENMDAEELVAWTVENAKVPVIGATERDTQAGALFSIVTSEKQIGWQAGQMAGKIISGTPVSDIPMEASENGKLLINAATVDKLGVEIPYDILSSAQKIYE